MVLVTRGRSLFFTRELVLQTHWFLQGTLAGGLPQAKC